MMSDHRTMNRTLNEHNMSESYLNGRDDLTGRIDQQFRASEDGLNPVELIETESGSEEESKELSRNRSKEEN